MSAWDSDEKVNPLQDLIRAIYLTSPSSILEREKEHLRQVMGFNHIEFREWEDKMNDLFLIR